MAKQYIMKGLDEALWHKVKVKAAKLDVSIKDVLVNFLKEWVKS